MTLAQISNIAGLISALGVIASVVFLAIELRVSNRETRLANWRQLLDSLRQYKAVTNDPYMSDLIERGNEDYAALSRPEQRSYGMYLEQGIHVIGNFTKHSGKVPFELTGLETAVEGLFRDLLLNPGGHAWWAATRDKRRFLPATHIKVDALLAKATQ